MRSRRLCPVPPASPSGPARVGLSVAEPGKLLIPASLLSLIQMFIDVSMFMSEKMPKNPGFCPAAAKNSPLLPPRTPRKSDISRQAQPQETAGETEEAAREECARLQEGTVPSSCPPERKGRGCARLQGTGPLAEEGAAGRNLTKTRQTDSLVPSSESTNRGSGESGGSMPGKPRRRFCRRK
jgi:hypothetical protein